MYERFQTQEPQKLGRYIFPLIYTQLFNHMFVGNTTSSPW